MKIEARRDLQLLRAVETDPRVTQRILASRFGMALGLTNIYLKRLAKHGYIKCMSTPSRRVLYRLTARGVARRIRLTREYVRYSLSLYADAKREVRLTVDGALRSGAERVALYGTGEAAEVAYLCLKEAGREPVVIFGDPPCHAFLGLPVRNIQEQGEVQFDLVLSASFEPGTSAVKQLLRQGVPLAKIVHLPSTLSGIRQATAKSSNE